MRMRSIRLSLALIAGTVAAGLAVRFVRVGLPQTVTKYGGSMLWALMIYWIVSTLRGRWRPQWAALLAGAVATAVEFFKLVDAPKLDAFRLTLPGILLLGRYFSAWDLLAYGVSIAMGAWADGLIRLRASSF